MLRSVESRMTHARAGHANMQDRQLFAAQWVQIGILARFVISAARICYSCSNLLGFVIPAQICYSVHTSSCQVVKYKGGPLLADQRQDHLHNYWNIPLFFQIPAFKESNSQSIRQAAPHDDTVGSLIWLDDGGTDTIALMAPVHCSALVAPVPRIAAPDKRGQFPHQMWDTRDTLVSPFFTITILAIIQVVQNCPLFCYMYSMLPKALSMTEPHIHSVFPCF